jgi:hypothetical protein
MQNPLLLGFSLLRWESAERMYTCQASRRVYDGEMKTMTMTTLTSELGRSFRICLPRVVPCCNAYVVFRASRRLLICWLSVVLTENVVEGAVL